ncbi:MAG TPA: T9SS type A sorting domain-containing protein, partial [Catalimonadaceae bacterium]|nr:T9SS type A sorting domain-containing protein [Catalimonadaceae bacterium]
NSTSSFQIQPNPGTGLFRLVSRNGQKATEIRVIDAQGKLLSIKTNQEKDLIDLRNFSSGLYTVQILSPSGNDFIRVMKE